MSTSMNWFEEQLEHRLDELAEHGGLPAPDFTDRLRVRITRQRRRRRARLAAGVAGCAAVALAVALTVTGPLRGAAPVRAAGVGQSGASPGGVPQQGGGLLQLPSGMPSALVNGDPAAQPDGGANLPALGTPWWVAGPTDHAVELAAYWDGVSGGGHHEVHLLDQEPWYGSFLLVVSGTSAGGQRRLALLVSDRSAQNDGLSLGTLKLLTDQPAPQSQVAPIGLSTNDSSTSQTNLTVLAGPCPNGQRQFGFGGKPLPNPGSSWGESTPGVWRYVWGDASSLQNPTLRCDAPGDGISYQLLSVSAPALVDGHYVWLMVGQAGPL
ncbi:hypothetical protein [Kitasatospora sp. LaBMicrA B282]|uniref:hypothetical protein n=1 Tax=Kitasatospora sp. LaBMicrA B282 TaxID=3420949 RepID=UPI003D0D6254